MDEASCSYSTETITTQLNDSLYELHKPLGEASMQVLFFHGFYLGDGHDAHLSTWKSGDDSCIWPETWLVKEFPDAQVLTVSYKAGLLRSSTGGKVDMYILAENLISDLLQAKIGQDPRCPVILVGHSFGGLVMKELCLHARNRGTPEHERFLSTVKGFFFYSTPHHGIPNLRVVSRFLSDSPLLEYVKTLSTTAARMNSEFDTLLNKYHWVASGVGENLPTKLGLLPAFEVVPEASSRYADFAVMPDADHITVCKPRSTAATSFNKLTRLLQNVSSSSMRVGRLENFQHLPEKLVGMEDILEKVKGRLLKATSLGLVGMGGIGKSTLAKALFNELGPRYEYTCFIRDVKNMTMPLADTILEQVHHWGKHIVEKGNRMWFLRGKRLLLILDDVAVEEKDLEIVAILQRSIAVHEGSRFVATSRDGELLQRCMSEVYCLDALGPQTSEQLFLSYAFPKGAPPSFMGDVDSIVQKCGGLPLALEVLGKHLQHKSESIWGEAKKAFSEARAIPGSSQDRLMSTLKLSYDGLHPNEQDMFLDAAIVFYDCKLDIAKKIWSITMEHSLHSRWQRLVDLSLVWEVVPRNGIGIYIGMHEQLRSLAIQIASISGANACRIWGSNKRTWEELFAEDRSDEDLKDIVALSLHRHGVDLRHGMVTLPSVKTSRLNKLLRVMACTSKRETDSEWKTRIHCIRGLLHRMENLRYLDLSDGDDGFTDCDRLPPSLVYLEYSNTECTSLPFYPSSHKRMGMLFLDCCQLRTLPANFGQLSRLRYLEIRASLESWPESFGELLCLEEFLLVRCYFQQLPNSFGRLKSLKVLKFYSKRRPRSQGLELKILPESFGGLSQLHSLELHRCLELEELPDSFGQLKNLKQVKFSFADKLKILPESFGGLSQLQSLTIDGCRELKALPDSFGRLENLKQVRLTGAEKLKALPEPFGGLSQLQSLELRDCPELEALPDSFGQLENLKQLTVFRAAKLKALPESFVGLSQLQSLTIDGCPELEALPDSFGQLENLKQLTVSRAAKLKALPESFGRLSQLQSLELSGCPELEALPDSFGRLENLEQMELIGADKLKALPESFVWLSQLQSLELNDCPELEALPDSFGQLENLKQLTVFRAAKLKALPESFVGLSQLQSLTITGCPELEALPDSFRQLENLKQLRVSHAAKLKALLQSFGGLSQLYSFSL